MSANCGAIVIFSDLWLIWNNRIPVAWTVKLTFSLIVNFFLTKTENRTKNSLTQLPHYCLSKGTIFFQKMLKFWKKC